MRRLGNRDGWSAKWAREMKQELLAKPEQLKAPKGMVSDSVVEASALSVRSTQAATLQQGGRAAGRQWLESFFYPTWAELQGGNVQSGNGV